MNIPSTISGLYNKARDNGRIDYILTLLRVRGIESYQIDPFLKIYNAVKNGHRDSLDDFYIELSSSSSPLFLIYNLISCVKSLHYNCAPFLDNSGTFPRNKISIHDQIDLTIKHAKNSNVRGLIKLLKEVYSSSETEIAKKWSLLRIFLIELLERYYNELATYKNFQTYHPFRNFMVMEILTNDEIGLYGFKVHFSNNSTALFERKQKSTVCINVAPRVPIEFFAGDLSQLKKEWMVDGKLLWQIGITGKYNKLGEWKPIVYPGETKHIEERLQQESDNYDVQGVLFYIYTTCHHVIEFVVKSPVDLPIKSVLTIGNKFHIWKCPVDKTDSEQSILYDGWLSLESIEPDYIEAALEYINLSVNRIGFIYDRPINWYLKYKRDIAGSGQAKVTKRDLKLFGKFLEVFPKSEDSFYLDYSIDWHNHANISKNPFIRFLCYFIAIESLALAITEARANLNIGYHKTNKAKRKEDRLKCISYYFDQLYSTDPTKFISESYFNCVVSLKERLKEITEILFGEEHAYIKLLFEKRDGHSLSSIRSDLAHGKLSLLNRKHASLVRKRVPEIAEISKEFISRIIYNLDRSKKVPVWSRKFMLSLQMSDPRSTSFVSHDAMIARKDWKIRKEWCD